MVKEKKSKKQVKSVISETPAVVSDTDERLSKKRRKAGNNDDDADVPIQSDSTVAVESEFDDDGDSTTKKKKMRSDNISLPQEGTEYEVACDHIAHEVTKHEQKLKNKFLTREERAKREKQRQMQAYVLELRAKGVNAKEIEKLKKKAKNKIKHVKPGMNFSDVVALADQQLECRECGAFFTFTVREQYFYKEKQFAAPVRCKDCYKAKKERMSNYDRK